MTQVLPYPLDAGPKVRAYHMLRHLAARHDVTLVSFTRDDDPPEALTHLREICGRVYAIPMRRSVWRNVRAGIRGLLTGLPMTIVRDEVGEMAALLRRLTSEAHFDVIHADQLSMAGWGLLSARLATGAPSRFALRDLRDPSRLRDPNVSPRLLLDEHNAVYLLASRMAADERSPLRRVLMHREAGAFRRYERAMCRAYHAVLTVTEEDRTHLLALQRSEPDFQHSDITAIPICVDPDQVAVVPRQPGGPPTILHMGTMFWPPNVAGVLWFAREVLPRVHAQIPDARFVIVGKSPPAEVQALASDPRIEVTGYVADATPYLAATDAFVVPLHAGGGMRVKILDAWLWGLPMVATAIGAEGIVLKDDLQDGENILIANEPDAFAAATLRLLADPALNARLRTAGRAWVERTYSWQAVYRQVDAVYERLLLS